MRLKHLFTINFFIAIVFGFNCTFLADMLLKVYGIVPDPASIWATRLTGGSILGFSTLMWFGRNTESVNTRKAITLALLIQDIVGFVASLDIQLGGKVNLFGWSSPFIYGLMAAGYAYFLFIRPDYC